MAIPFDPYVIDILLPDLVGHDKSAAAFLVYLYLWRHVSAAPRNTVQVSYATLANETGLSKTTAQRAVRHLKRRGLIATQAASATAVPRYSVLRPWLGRLRAGSV